MLSEKVRSKARVLEIIVFSSFPIFGRHFPLLRLDKMASCMRLAATKARTKRMCESSRRLCEKDLSWAGIHCMLRNC